MNIKTAEEPSRRRCRGAAQLGALLRKHWLHHLRTPFATLMEILSPVLMMLILVAAYRLSEIDYREARSYSILHFNLNPWLGFMDALSVPLVPPGLSTNASTIVGQRRALLQEWIDEAEDVNRNDWLTDWSKALLWPLEIVPRQVERQRRRLDDEYNDVRDDPTNDTMFEDGPVEEDEDMSDLDALTAINIQMGRLFLGPMPIPTLDQYVSLSQAIRQFVNVDKLPSIVEQSNYGRQWGNLLTLGALHVVQPSLASLSFVDYLLANHPVAALGQVTIREHDTVEEALDYIQTHVGKERTWALLDLTQLGNGPKQKYAIRMNHTAVPNTNQIVDFVAIGLSTRYQQYYRSGYLTLQRTLNEYVFAVSAGSCRSVYNTTNEQATDHSNVWSMPMPTAAYSQNSFFLAVGYLLGLTIVMAYLYPTSRLVKLIVEEKELRIKETLMIMGVHPWAYWWSWCIFYLVLFVVVAILVTATLTTSVLHYSSPAYLLVWIGLFSTAIMGFCFAIAALFNRAKLAAVIGPMAVFATVLPRFIFFGTNRYEGSVAKKWASLLPATAFAFGADVVADYEYAEQGIQSWNASEGAYSFNTSMEFLLLDTFLYFFLGWYLEQVLPKEYGSPRPFYFIVSPWYWCSCFFPRKTAPAENLKVATEQVAHNGDHEPVTESSLVPGVEIRGLVKRFGGKKNQVVAVNNLNLTLYQSQITTLLGHNGAGKTTTVSMLTGLLPPTSGDCSIYGKSIVHNQTEARQSIGICPQQNTLFDRLSVYEHIFMFQRITGVAVNASTVRKHAEELGLGQYLFTTADALSGGNKRKLSVAIALSGDPKLVVLDEPSSGMDPKARRGIWEVLRKKRAGRVILLTTHFMDEAELLSDRVAIMKEGQLACTGSPVFLKERFGLGYCLTVVTNVSGSSSGRDTEATAFSAETDPESQLTDNRSPDSIKDNLLSFLRGYIPGTELTRTFGKELTFRLPKGAEDSFPDTFDALEAARERLNVGDFGIENASLEEVFIRLAEEEVPGHETKDQAAPCDAVENEQAIEEGTPERGEVSNEDQTVDSAVEGVVSPPASDATDGSLPQTEYHHLSATRQVGLLYWKRAIIQRRDIKGACFLVIVPVVLVALVLLILTVTIPFAGPGIELTLDLYNTSSTGMQDSTNVLVSGGAILPPNGVVRPSPFEEEYELFSRLMNESYSLADFQYLRDEYTSGRMSRFLLETYNDHDHHPRFGSLIMDDIIRVHVWFNWTIVADMIGEVDTGSIGDSLQGDIENSSLVNNALGSPMLDDLLSLNGLGVIDSVNIGDMLSLLRDSLSEDARNRSASDADGHYSYQMQTTASILHNSSSAHAVAAFNQMYSEYLYKTCSGDPRASVVSENHPLPLTTQQTIEIRTILSVLASLFVLIPFCYVPGAFIVFLVKEKTCKSKHLQLVSGVNLSSYWLATYLWDMTLYFVLTVIAMLVFLAYGKEAAVVFVGTAESFVCTMALIFGYGLSVLPFSYLISRSFDNHSSSQIAVIGVVFVTGFVAVNAYFIMSSLETTEELAEQLRPLFRTWPAYNIGDGLILMAQAYWRQAILDEDRSPFDWDVAGKPLALIYGLALPYWTILLLLEYANDAGSGGIIGRGLRACSRWWEKILLRCYGVRVEDGILRLDDGLDDVGISPDDDVEKERRFVSEHEGELKTKASVLYENLWKVYPPSIGLFGALLGALRRLIACLCCFACRRFRPQDRTAEVEDRRKAMLPKRAVRGVTTAVSEGETYALLGKNGAGKSTTIGVLTGDATATSGTVHVVGHDVTGNERNGVAEARKHIGFCPQVDPLLELMSGRETLRLFARLRGVPPNQVDSHVNSLLDRLTLTPHADKTTEQYSGGNKRKLSLGIALIGDPKLLLIDEPSTGLDPVAKRKGMWKLISEVSKDRSVILTTHSMHEAEALCTRAGIMSDGQLLCIGSVQHLKSKYLDGYTIDFNCQSDSDMDSMIEYVRCNLPGSSPVERHGRFVRFSLPHLSATIGLGQAFLRLQDISSRTVANDGWKVEQYSVSQCSLEQVFLQLIEKDKPSVQQRGTVDDIEWQQSVGTQRPSDRALVDLDVEEGSNREDPLPQIQEPNIKDGDTNDSNDLPLQEGDATSSPKAPDGGDGGERQG